MHPNGHPPHILCINHTPEVLALLRDLLMSEGYRVSTMPLVERNLNTVVNLRPDLITVDSLWTSSDDEWAFLTMIRMDPRTQGIPVILCTGAVSEVSSMQPHLSDQGIRIVFKPFDIDVLLREVRDALHQEPATEPPPPPNA